MNWELLTKCAAQSQRRAEAARSRKLARSSRSRRTSTCITAGATAASCGSIRSACRPCCRRPRRRSTSARRSAPRKRSSRASAIARARGRELSTAAPSVLVPGRARGGEAELHVEAARGLRADRQHDLSGARRAATARSTGCACRASTRRPASRRCSAAARTAAGSLRRPDAARDASASLPTPARPCSRRASRPSSGEAALIDFMPLTDDEDKVDVVRIVRGIRGERRLRHGAGPALRLRHGRAVGAAARLRAVSAIAGPDAVELHTRRAARRPRPDDARASSRCAKATACRSRCRTTRRTSRRISCRIRSESLNQTMTTWREWSKRCRLRLRHERWNDAVIRSLITLKLLTYRADGRHRRGADDVAAGEARRLAQLGLPLLLDPRLGADALRAPERGLSRRGRELAARGCCAPRRGIPEQLRIMYGISGERWLPELELPWLAGYENSTPVRIGNLAASPAPARRLRRAHGRAARGARSGARRRSTKRGRCRRRCCDDLERAWKEPDHGIWETRGPARAFTHSRLMSWVAFDRGVKSCERFGLDGPVERWREIRGRDSRRRLRERVRREAQHVRAVLRRPASSTPRCC